MIKFPKSLLAMAAWSVLQTAAHAVELANYNFTGNLLESADADANSTAGSFLAGPGYNTAGGVFFVSGTRAVGGTAINSSSASTNLSAGDYFEFTVTPTSGRELNLQTLTFASSRPGSSPDRVSVYTSANNFASPILNTATVPGTHAIDLMGGEFQRLTSVTFRIVTHGNNVNLTTNSRYAAYDNIVLNGDSLPPTGAPGRWSDPATWGGPVPIAGQNVTIPVGTTVTLDTTTPSLGIVEVYGTLRFDPTKAVGITTHHLVIHGGLLEIGTAAQPHLHKSSITLTGINPAEVITVHGHATGSKGLVVVNGGGLEIHGHRAQALSWTKLAANANPGATSITLVDSAASWRVGDQLAIAPSGFRAMDAEKVTITAVSGNTVSFTPALVYAHWGTLQTIDGKPIDERAEVGLLTRDIVIRGDSTSDTNQFGGHVMVTHGCFARVQGVEFHKMGQMRLRGRYPFHWHLTGDGTGQWIKNSSVHDGFHRGIVTHGIDNALVEGNVTFDLWSHHYVPSEDGVEYHNYYKNNLGILLKGLKEIDFAFAGHKEPGNQSEERPGIFWTRRANQYFEGNHAAGVRKEGTFGGFGFFFDWGNRGAKQANAEIPLFTNNVAHSIEGNSVRDFAYQPGHSGAGFFFTAYFPDPARPQVLENSFAYKCASYGYWFTEPAHVIENCSSADTASAFFGTQAEATDCLFVGSTANTIGGAPPNGGAEGVHSGIYTPRKNERQKVYRLKNVTFVNWRSHAVFWGESFASLGAVFQGIRVINCPKPLHFHNDYDSTLFYAEPDGYILDADGSLTGTGYPTAVFNDGQGFQNTNSTFVATGNYYRHRLVDGPAAIVDNSSATITGSWTAKVAPAGFYGSNYLSDDNAGKGSKSATFSFTSTGRAYYREEIQYPNDATLATNVPVDTTGNVNIARFYSVNQSTGGGVWRPIDYIRLENGGTGRVAIANYGTNKAVAADAVRFVQLQRQ